MPVASFVFAEAVVKRYGASCAAPTVSDHWPAVLSKVCLPVEGEASN